MYIYIIYVIIDHYIYIYIHQGIIQEFAVEAIKPEFGISSNRAEGFGGLFMSKSLTQYDI